MKVNFLKSKYKENRFILNTMILAVILIGAFAGSIVLFKFYNGKNEQAMMAQTVELQREVTLEQIQSQENLIRYLFKAVSEADVDMALRACPIDEIGLNIDTEIIIENMGEFSPTSTVAPSKQYRDYFPLTSAELTSDYTEDILAFIKAYQKKEEIQILKIDYAHPEKQLESENMLRYQTICDVIGADAVCEISALLGYQEKEYLAGFTLASYYGGWKVLSFTSNLTGTSEEEFIRESVNPKEDIFNDIAAKELEEELDSVLDDEKIEEHQDATEIANMIENGIALLPANYFVMNSAYGLSPQDLMEQITRYIEKRNTQALISYYVADRADEETLNNEYLLQQGNIAKNIQIFYFALLSEGKEQNGTLEELGKTASDIVEEQNPENMFYLDLMKVIYNENDGLCQSFFWYGGNIYEVDFVLQESEKGWQIKEMKAVKQISQKEYDRMK